MADTRLRCAVVGCGRISSEHIDGFRRAPDTSIVALCDTNEEAARNLASSQGLHDLRLFTDYRQMLDEIRPDIVSVAVPDSQHPQVVAAAAKIGAHVLCEKPLALTGEHAGDMVRMVREQGVQNGVRMPYRFSAVYRYILDWIRSGSLGTPFHIRGHLSVGRLSDPAVPIEWRMRRESGGLGALSDLGSHLIDLTFFLLDEWVSEISAVTGFSKIFHRQRRDLHSGNLMAVTAPDAVVCAISFASGCILNLEVSRVSPGDHLFQIDGSEGSVRCTGNEVWTYRRIHSEHQRPETQFSRVSTGELAHYREPGLFEEFVRCCRSGEEFRPGFADGKRVVDASERIYNDLLNEESE